MLTLLDFIARISRFLYLLAGIGIFVSLRSIFQAQRKYNKAVYGLERDTHQRQQKRGTSNLIILLLLISAVYIITNILVPNLSENQTAPESTPVIFVTQQPTPTEIILLFPTITPTVGVPPAEAGTPIPTPDTEGVSCEISGVTITSPERGQNVSGQVPVEGQANILNFAQYKFELSSTGIGNKWIVVGTYVNPVNSGLLGVWDSTSLPSGPYTLRLSVYDQDGSAVTPCDIPIVILHRETEP